MLSHVLFDLALFVDEADRPSSQKRILWLLEALTRIDQLYLQQHPDTPLIYKSGIVYKVPAQFETVPEVARVREFLTAKSAPSNVTEALEALERMVGGERFRDIPKIIANGGGDCDNVATWRAAELRQLGIAAQPYITWRRRPDGGMTYHVIVRWPDGSSEDPSLLLGMGGEDRAPDRAAEVEKLAERTANFVKGVTFTRQLNGGLTVLNSDDHDAMLNHLRGETVVGDSNFGKGLQYTSLFWTDDAYEDWSPTRPQAYYADPRFPGLNQGGPLLNTRMRRDPDDDFDIDDKLDDVADRFDGLSLPRLKRHLLRTRLRRRAA